MWEATFTFPRAWKLRNGMKAAASLNFNCSDPVSRGEKWISIFLTARGRLSLTENRLFGVKYPPE
jgi:hypothetical protein